MGRGMEGQRRGRKMVERGREEMGIRKGRVGR